MTERKDLIQEFLLIEPGELLETALELRTAGYRLGQACATLLGDQLELLYSFEKDNVLRNEKLTVDAAAPELPSITPIYSYAFVYENEMHDLFGITFRNLSLDYGGAFYKIARETPWNPKFGGGEKAAAPSEDGVSSEAEGGEA
ncbi:MAG: NADH-quinone oxidoreductase subunit C [Clostridiales bacterium]|nr:NADH-quinone oxidoreductase subunit C [Clostridiales bacterium]